MTRQPAEIFEEMFRSRCAIRMPGELKDGVRPGLMAIRLPGDLIEVSLYADKGESLIGQIFEQLPDDVAIHSPWADGHFLQLVPSFNAGCERMSLRDSYLVILASYEWPAPEEGYLIPEVPITFKRVIKAEVCIICRVSPLICAVHHPNHTIPDAMREKLKEAFSLPEPLHPAPSIIPDLYQPACDGASAIIPVNKRTHRIRYEGETESGVTIVIEPKEE